jgi:hypothetical protein
MDALIFFRVAESEMGYPIVERIDPKSARWADDSTQAFVKTATVGAVLQIGQGEYIVALGPLVLASWMKVQYEVQVREG